MGVGLGSERYHKILQHYSSRPSSPHTWDCCAEQVCAGPTLGLSTLWKCSQDQSILKAAQGAAGVRYKVLDWHVVSQEINNI